MILRTSALLAFWSLALQAAAAENVAEADSGSGAWVLGLIVLGWLILVILVLWKMGPSSGDSGRPPSSDPRIR